MSVWASSARAGARGRAARFQRSRPDASGVDPAELVAEVAAEKWAVLLRSYEGRLERGDLEDCLSQATFELVRVVRTGRCFDGAEHVANALELKFRSRIVDQHRARSARPAAVALGEEDEAEDAVVLEDRSPRFERGVEARFELERLRELVGELSVDEQRVLVLQGAELSRREICERLGWALERYRSTAKRATEKLAGLVAAADRGERCRALKLPLYAWVAGLASEEEAGRLAVHVGSCAGCRAEAAALRHARQQLGELVPWPVLVAGGGVLGWLSGRATGTRVRLSALVGREPSGGVGHPESAAGGALAGGTAAKAVLAACLAGGAVSGACLSTGVFSPGVAHRVERHAHGVHHRHVPRRHTRRPQHRASVARIRSAPRVRAAPTLRPRRAIAPPPSTYATSPPPSSRRAVSSPSSSGEFTLGPSQTSAPRARAASQPARSPAPAPAPASGGGEFTP